MASCTKLDPVLFFHSSSVFSNFYASKFEIDGQVYKWSEQYMMAEKARLFGDKDSLRKIMAAKTPAACKKLGRKITPFCDDKWVAHIMGARAMERGLLAKFMQNGDLGAALLATGDRPIAEASPYDKRWGLGVSAKHPMARDPRQWRSLGCNYLGHVLMSVRDTMRLNLLKLTECK